MAKRIASRKTQVAATSRRLPNTGMEEVLERSGEELRLITAPLDLAIAYFDLDQRYFFTNEAYEKWVERSRQEIEGRQIKEVLGEAVYEKIRGHVEAALSGELVTFEDILPYKERGPRHVAVTYRPYLGKMGNVEGFVALVKDITTLKEAETALRRSDERFRVSLMHSPVVVFQQDMKLRYTWIHNPGPGLTVEGVQGKTDEQLLAPDHAARLTQMKEQVLASGVGTRREVQASIGGHIVWQDLTIEPLRDETGAVIGVTGASFNITERKQTEQALQRAKDGLEGKVARLERHLAGDGVYGLTVRELTVLHLMAEGKSDKGIATELGISHLTVHKHAANVRKKLEVGSRTEAVAKAIRERLVE